MNPVARPAGTPSGAAWVADRVAARPAVGVKASFVLVSAPPAAGWIVALPQR